MSCKRANLHEDGSSNLIKKSSLPFTTKSHQTNAQFRIPRVNCVHLSPKRSNPSLLCSPSSECPALPTQRWLLAAELIKL